MKKLLVISILSFSIGLLLTSFLAYANQSSINNYYPSPSGNYTKIHLVNSTGNLSGTTTCSGSHPGTIFADSNTGFLEICKADGTYASYPGSCFNRFGSGTCPGSLSGMCPSNYEAVSCQPFMIGTGAGTQAYTYSCCFTGQGNSTTAATAKSGCFSIYGTNGTQPAFCNPASGATIAGDANAYDVGCDAINSSDMTSGPVFKRNCCFNNDNSSLSKSYFSTCAACTGPFPSNATACSSPPPSTSIPYSFAGYGGCTGTSCTYTCNAPDVYNNAGACLPGCNISGIFYTPGQKDPSNPCLSCQTATSTSAWTDVTTGTSCDGTDVCYDGNCDFCIPGSSAPCGSGVCTGTMICNASGSAYGSCSTLGNTCVAATSCTNASTCTSTGTCPAPTDLPIGTSCGSGDVCYDGSCDFCVPGSLASCGSGACAGNETCNGSGSGYGSCSSSGATCVAATSCASSSTCTSTGTCPAVTDDPNYTLCPGGVCLSGVCTPTSCTPNAVTSCGSGICSGTETCNSTGSAESSCTSAGTLCAPATVCSNASSCNSSGSCPAVTDLPNGTICPGGICQSGACVPVGTCSGAPLCDGTAQPTASGQTACAACATPTDPVCPGIQMLCTPTGWQITGSPCTCPTCTGGSFCDGTVQPTLLGAVSCATGGVQERCNLVGASGVWQPTGSSCACSTCSGESFCDGTVQPAAAGTEGCGTDGWDHLCLSSGAWSTTPVPCSCSSCGTCNPPSPNPCGNTTGTCSLSGASCSVTAGTYCASGSCVSGSCSSCGTCNPPSPNPCGNTTGTCSISGASCSVTAGTYCASGSCVSGSCSSGCGACNPPSPNPCGNTTGTCANPPYNSCSTTAGTYCASGSCVSGSCTSGCTENCGNYTCSMTSYTGANDCSFDDCLANCSTSCSGGPGGGTCNGCSPVNGTLVVTTPCSQYCNASYTETLTCEGASCGGTCGAIPSGGTTTQTCSGPPSGTAPPVELGNGHGTVTSTWYCGSCPANGSANCSYVGPAPGYPGACQQNVCSCDGSCGYPDSSPENEDPDNCGAYMPPDPCGGAPCGEDGCGLTCGSGCSSGYHCSSTNSPGTCICTAGTCPTDGTCGKDTCGNADASCGCSGTGACCTSSGTCSTLDACGVCGGGCSASSEGSYIQSTGSGSSPTVTVTKFCACSGQSGGGSGCSYIGTCAPDTLCQNNSCSCSGNGSSCSLSGDTCVPGTSCAGGYAACGTDGCGTVCGSDGGGCLYGASCSGGQCSCSSSTSYPCGTYPSCYPVSGCDNACNSSATIDCCGICGGDGYCETLPGLCISLGTGQPECAPGSPEDTCPE